MTVFSLFKKASLSVVAFLLGTAALHAQYLDSSTGLLQMPTADMQADGTFMITNNFVNKNALSKRWGYDTFQYGFAVSFWKRVEIGYVCTIFNGAWDPRPNKTERQRIIRNQDRHFTGRVLLLREGEFGLDWMPALVAGISDPTTGSGGYEYAGGDVSGGGNGYFNRNFMVLTKHFQTSWGDLGAHMGYQFNRRNDYSINAPCAGVDWKPVWLHRKGILDDVDCIVEFDSRTVNAGVIASVWDNRFEVMFELQNFRWINFGLRYKVRIRK
ncbi:MAG: YjbH domain-containing protein [Bacteroidales bacterium]|nr:YjbH domain-containing protein [Bacteroidales bacterium]